jgi:predicted Na+-dependent transporter
VPAGPLRDGVLVTGLAPCEIASVATTALAGGEAAVAAGVLIGSTLATVVLAAPILTLEAGRASFSPAGLIANLAVVVAVPLAAGIALRCWVGVTARVLASGRAQTVASRTAIAAVAVLVALVAAEVHLTVGYAAVAGALALFLAASAVAGRVLGVRSARPAGSALLLTTSMRDFAIAAALAAAAFGPRAAAPLGLYGVAVLIWGTAVAGALRARALRARGSGARAGPRGQAG